MNCVSTIPPITDDLSIAIRAYVAPTFRELQDTGEAKPNSKRKAPMPASQ